MDLKELDILEGDISAHWYYLSKARALEKIVSDLQIERVLDVGAGSGFFSEWLLNRTDIKTAVCVDPNYEEEFTRVINGKKIYFVKEPGNYSADLVLMMDVVEHVKDDVGLIEGYVRNVDRGTLFVISVPAFRFLWSGHDVFLGHYRRYSIRHLMRVIQGSGLNIERVFYYYGLVFPIAAVVRIFSWLLPNKISHRSNLKKHSAMVNVILKRLCVFELSWMRVNRLFGLTIFSVASKK